VLQPSPTSRLLPPKSIIPSSSRWEAIKGLFWESNHHHQQQRLGKRPAGAINSSSPSPLVLSSRVAVIYRVIGDLTYLSALSHVHRLKLLKSKRYVILSFSYCYYADGDGLRQMEETITQITGIPTQHSRPQLQDGASERPRTTLLVAGINPVLLPVLTTQEWYNYLNEQGFVFDSVKAAMGYIDSLDHGILNGTPPQASRRSSLDGHYGTLTTSSLSAWH